MRETLSPSLIYQLKRALGDDSLSLEAAVRLAIEQATEARGLKIALHNAILSPSEHVPSAAERFVEPEELEYARVRQMGRNEPMTSVQVARYLKVPLRRINVLFDAKRLQGWRNGNNGERLIPRAEVERFRTEQGL